MNRTSLPHATAGLVAGNDERLCEALKRCPPSVLNDAREFRRTGDSEHLSALVYGLIERHMDRGSQSRLTHADADLRLIEDLGIDSLTLMEVVMLAEDALDIAINNADLRLLRTVGDVQRFIARALQVEPPPDLAQPESRAHLEPERREGVAAV